MELLTLYGCQHKADKLLVACPLAALLALSCREMHPESPEAATRRTARMGRRRSRPSRRRWSRGRMQDQRREDRRENPDAAAGQQEGRQRCRQALRLCGSEGCGHVDPREELSPRHLAHCEGGVPVRIGAACAGSRRDCEPIHVRFLTDLADLTDLSLVLPADAHPPACGCSE